MTARLATVAQDLVVLIELASDRQRRSAAVTAAAFAVERAQLQDRRIDVALLAVQEGRLGATSERTAAEAAASELDEEQWDIQDLLDQGEADSDAQLHAFGKARAAMAVFYAADPDPQVAALEAIYEAGAVVDDLDELRSLVVPALRG